MRIGFLGLGKMGAALANALASSPFTLLAYDPKFPGSSPAMPKGIEFAASPQYLEENCEIVLICVKPQDIAAALSELSGSRLYISIAAGVSVESISALLQIAREKVCRAMPNIAALAKQSISAIYCEADPLFQRAAAIFSYAGTTLRVAEEENLHAITALSGSGPGFIYLFFNAMVKAGTEIGLGKEIALQLASETFQGALALLKNNYGRAEELLDQVASAKGTTAAGIECLKEGKFEETIAAALIASTARSRELQASIL